MKPLIAWVATAAVTVAALFVSACTSPAPSDGHADHQHGAESSAAQPATNNAADVAFITGMIPHHRQAMDLSALVPQRSTNPALIGLAADVSAEQGPEIETMKAFLVQWNADTDNVHDGHDMGAMNGMVDDPTMTKLETLRGAAFDELWLRSMIGHHEGAIAMAKTELTDGANVDAKTLAGQIVTAQQAEIGQMTKMLGQ